jgi:hypothetical protein
MKRIHPARNNPADLSLIDVQTIRESITARTACWGIRSSRGPGPLSPSSGRRWAYVYWDGPPSDDIIPALAVSRCVLWYHITILDPLEFFSRGAFETTQRHDLAGATELIVELMWEFREMALKKGTQAARSATYAYPQFDVN